MIRIYEFSKQYNVPTRELLSALRGAGFTVKSHMSMIDENAVKFLKKRFKGSSTGAASSKKKDTPKVITKKTSVVASKKQVVALSNQKQEKQENKKEKKREGFVVSAMTVVDAALNMKQPVNEVILLLLRWRIVAVKNRILSEDIIRRLADHYGIETIEAIVAEKETKQLDFAPKKGEDLASRLPVVVVLGHVDHGKTTLLDFIRKTRVAIREKGGITQHVGAYEATTAHGNVVFLDTPGHEAFSKMRQRGVRIADIAILVVAADDGVMPQTVEAIKHIKNMNVPIIVAINKIDKVDASRMDIVKRELAQHDVLPEDWGGDAICVPISAKEGTNVDQLLEMVILQSQIMELRAAQSGPAKAYVLEAKLEKGYGSVATVISRGGIIAVGDFFVCGNTVGRVTSLINSYGKRIQKVGPSIPVQVSGFQNLPEVGDYFEVVTKEKYLKRRGERQDFKTSRVVQPKQEGDVNLIVKADTNSSKEALLDAMDRLSRKFDRGFNIIDSGIGRINESNVELAFNTGASIVGLHVKTEVNALLLAQQRGVSITLFDIIYKLLEDLEKRIEKPLKVDMIRKKIGEAVVLRVFDIKKVGVIAGSHVKDGRFVIGGYVEVWRDNQKVGEGKITSLQREKKSVKEVHTGFECGFVVENFVDWAVDDRVECFIEVPKQ